MDQVQKKAQYDETIFPFPGLKVHSWPRVHQAKLDHLFVLVKVQRDHHQRLFYHTLKLKEKLRMPTQLSHLEQKPKMFLMKKAPFSIFFLDLTKISSCSPLPDQPGFVMLDKMQDEGQWCQVSGEHNQKFSNVTTTPVVCHRRITAWPPSPGKMKQGQKKLLNSSGCFSFIELPFWAKGWKVNKTICIL